MASNRAFRIDAKGVEQALRNAKKARNDIVKGLETETEKAALRAVNDAAENAPYRDGLLKNSIVASPKRVKDLEWSVGSDRPYAQRQEYEHKSNRGFFRKALFRERTKFREAIQRVLKRAGGGGG